MHPIIVAVDFSNSSVHAIEYSISLANKLESDVILVWVDKLTAAESIYPDLSNDTRNEAKKRFEEVIAQYGKMLNPGIKMEYKLKKGKIYHELEILAKNVSATLIIAGTHGLSGFEEFWIGSNAFKIVTYASCPVITIRHDFEITESIEKIMVPIDSSAETLQKLPLVSQLAKLFNSEVHIVATHYCNLKSLQRVAEKFAQQAIQYLQKNKVRCINNNIVAEDITKGVINYARNMGIDLIAIMTEQETPINILLGPHSQRLINQADKPILSIHPQEHFCL
ncbi:MAG: universal stress protein [Bacteroidetes bacterium]|nr:universal stress protein [Bacteroidota bacterium]